MNFRWLMTLALIACHPKEDARRDVATSQTARVTSSPQVASIASSPQDAIASSPQDGSIVSPTLRKTPVTDLVQRLADHPPSSMSELEAIVGPIHMSFLRKDVENMGALSRPRPPEREFTSLVPRLSVRYAFDMYHQEPTRQRDVSLTELILEVRGDPADAEQVLGQKFGAPRTVTEKLDGSTSSTTYAAFHPFYVSRDPALSDRFRLSWFAQVPRFAIPEPDPKARLVWLRALEHRIATAKTIDEVDAFCKALPPGVGMKITGTLNVTANPYGLPARDPRDYWIAFVPPVRAAVLADVFHWAPVVGVSHDVHMSSWHLERRGARWYPISGVDAQWQIEAHLTAQPSGPTKLHDGPGPSVFEIGEDNEVGTLAVAPRFK